MRSRYKAVCKIYRSDPMESGTCYRVFVAVATLSETIARYRGDFPSPTGRDVRDIMLYFVTHLRLKPHKLQFYCNNNTHTWRDCCNSGVPTDNYFAVLQYIFSATGVTGSSWIQAARCGNVFFLNSPRCSSINFQRLLLEFMVM